MPVKIQELLVRVNISGTKKNNRPEQGSHNTNPSLGSTTDIEKNILESVYAHFTDKNER
jgi:hypothetical protein